MSTWEERMAERTAAKKPRPPLYDPFDSATIVDLREILERALALPDDRSKDDSVPIGCACVGRQEGCHLCPCKQRERARILKWG